MFFYWFCVEWQQDHFFAAPEIQLEPVTCWNSFTRSHLPTHCVRKMSKGFLARVLMLWVCFVGPSSLWAQTSATVGQWSAKTTWPFNSVHSALLPTGKVLWWPSFNNGDNPTIWDPAANTNTAAVKAGANIFCAGHALLSDGQLFVAGGHITNWTGLPNAYKYNPSNRNWTRLPDMNAGRWYPSSTELPNGDILMTSGWIDSGTGVNVEPQVWQNASGSWRNLTAA